MSNIREHWEEFIKKYPGLTHADGIPSPLFIAQEAHAAGWTAGWDARKQEVFKKFYGGGYKGDCEACNVETMIGTEEVPHPVNAKLHSCITEQERNDLAGIPKKVNVYRCKKCKSKNVEHAMWVHINTDDVRGSFGDWNEHDTSMCNDCEARGCIEEIPLEERS